LRSDDHIWRQAVDRQNPMQVALDFSTAAPIVTMPRPADGVGSAAALLMTGTPTDAVIVSNSPLGLRTWDGHDMYLFTLTVIPTNGAPYQVQVGNPMPANALPYVFPGARVPVKMGVGANDLAVTGPSTGRWLRLADHAVRSAGRRDRAIDRSMADHAVRR
jgi:hypothetical protein